MKQPIGPRPSLQRWYDQIENRVAVQKAVEIYLRLRAPAAAR